MPKTSKVQITKPKPAAPIEDERKEFYCCRCKRHFTKQKGNFPASQSPLYDGNGKYLTICNHCVDELFEHYKAALGDEAEAIRRICLKFDIYWNPEIYAMLNKASTSHSRVRTYISKTNLYKYVGKTYDDTLDEEYQAEIERQEEAERIAKESVVTNIEDVYDEDEQVVVPESVVRYWGSGFTPEMYIELENRRSYWMSQFPEGSVLEPGEEALLRQICIMEISINRDLAAGSSVEKSSNALNSLLGSMNIKPSQRRESNDSAVPFGCEIAKWEEDEPIVEPDKEFQDVDGMRKNVITWFLGSLCKTAGIKNEYSQYFDDEVKKYTVERPTYEEDTGFEDDGVEEDGEVNG